jgi:hypothetical protein
MIEIKTTPAPVENHNKTAEVVARVLGYSCGLLFRAAVFIACVYWSMSVLSYFNLMPPV